MNDLVVFSGNAHFKLAEDICSCLKIKLSEALVCGLAKGR